MRVRMEPEDEYMHAVDEAANFNESMYFNVYDPAEKIGGWFRLGNRANEGYAEMTTCIYLPDGSVGFMYGRPEIKDNDAFVRRYAAQALGTVGPDAKTAVPFLGFMVMGEKERKEGQVAAAVALGKIGSSAVGHFSLISNDTALPRGSRSPGAMSSQ